MTKTERITEFKIERDGKTLKGRVVCDGDGLEIFVDGYGNFAMAPGHGSIALLEVGDDGHPALHAFANLENEDANTINFSEAFECYPVGTKVRAVLRTRIDEDDDGNKRYAEPGEEGEITMTNVSSEDGRFINYEVTFPRTGAFAFFDPGEFAVYFTVVA